MEYNPAIHHRRSIRKKGYDYSKAGLYFITICCQDMTHRFGQVINGKMILNELGQQAHDAWASLPHRFSPIAPDIFQIMPNHMHGIIRIVRAPLAGAHTPLAGAHTPLADNHYPPADDWTGASPVPTSPTIGDIVGAYKSLVSNACLNIYKSKNQMMGKLWQRNYYEHIIRNEQAYMNISNYIINNPVKWCEDKFYK